MGKRRGLKKTPSVVKMSDLSYRGGKAGRKRGGQEGSRGRAGNKGREKIHPGTTLIGMCTHRCEFTHSGVNCVQMCKNTEHKTVLNAYI